jgi:hypothetical protein
MIINNSLQSQPNNSNFPVANAKVGNKVPSYPIAVYVNGGAEKSDFEKALDEIEIAGDAFERNSRNAAISGLAKILGIYTKFFANATKSEITSLKSKLKERCGLEENKKTSEFHLLSRIYRRNDTKQASGDAKILKQAISAEKDENSFAEWVASKGGLDAIKKGVTDQQKQQRAAQPPKKPNPKDLWERAANAIKALVHNGQITETFTFEKKEWPDSFKKLRPDFNNTSRLVIVNHTDDDLHFHILESFQPFGPDYVPKHPVNVDGTSTSTWPAWMIGTEPEAPEESNDDSGSVKETVV